MYKIQWFKQNKRRKTSIEESEGQGVETSELDF